MERGCLYSNEVQTSSFQQQVSGCESKGRDLRTLLIWLCGMPQSSDKQDTF